MEGLLVFVFMFAIIIPIILLQLRGYEKAIHEKIESLGGTYLYHKRAYGFIGIGPYKFVGKGSVVYRFEYRVGSEDRQGWVKFNGWGGADWRL